MKDMIYRQAAIDEINERQRKLIYCFGFENDVVKTMNIAKSIITAIPSVQPERTCVNCGRTANNGGWYADGRTRCQIEEHYALPKDGFCHLWEKRNITDDDYPERREE